MKFVHIIGFCVFVTATFAFVDGEAEPCVPEKCKLADGCVCSSSKSPLPLEKTPQFITITIDDSVLADSYERYYSKLLFNRKHADGSPISANFYVPHIYTDYEAVNNLYNNGFEIGVNSITKGTAEYFANASLQELTDEFDGQRKIVAKFANISIEYVIGARTPHFQLKGDDTFEAYKKAGLVYDHSWVALSHQNLFPYSLHYRSSQPSIVGQAPILSYPKQWVVPVNNFLGKSNDCNVLFNCGLNGTASDISNWLIKTYNNTKHSTRAPINLLINSAWFQLEEHSLEGVQQFLNYVLTQKDTFLISHSQLVSWAKNPKPLGEYKPVVKNPEASCTPITCPLKFGEEIRYMKSCVACPNVYPWLKNPEGK